MLPLALRQAKNKLIGDEPWLVLLDVTLPDASHIRLVRNTEDVTFGGELYTAFPFELGENRVGGDGRISGVRLTIDDPAGATTLLREEYSGLVGCATKVMVVHAGNLTADHSSLTLDWEVLDSSQPPGSTKVTFLLGMSSPMRRRFPLINQLPLNCAWVFKGAECAYAGAATSCARTLDACRALNNSARFGGRPGILRAPRFVGL